MSERANQIAIAVASVIIIAAVAVAAYRGGALAWIALASGSAGLYKAWRRPGSFDLPISLALALLFAGSWSATMAYVINTYESGEVIELSFDTSVGQHTARVWVFDVDGTPTVYYDAPPRAAQALLDGQPVTVALAGDSQEIVPRAITAAEVDKEHSARVFSAMANKYGDRMQAADVYYVLLGTPRGRVPVLIELQGAGL